MLALAIIALVLVQQSEGGGLGIGGGGGGGMGGLATARGTASLLTRLTTIFALCFMVTSLSLAVLAKKNLSERPASILELANDPEVTVPAARDDETTIPAVVDEDALKGESGEIVDPEDINSVASPNTAPEVPRPDTETEPSVPLSE